MKMNITHHCDKRMAERGRRTSDIRAILKYGKRRKRLCLMTRRKVNTSVRRITRWLSAHSSPRFQKRAAQARALIRLLERVANWMVVAAADLTESNAAVKVVTVFHAGKNQRRKFATGVVSEQEAK